MTANWSLVSSPAQGVVAKRFTKGHHAQGGGSDVQDDGLSADSQSHSYCMRSHVSPTINEHEYNKLLSLHVMNSKHTATTYELHSGYIESLNSDRETT